AMILFKYESMEFRKSFFSNNQFWAVANFANFAEVLFGGRARLPAAVLFFSVDWFDVAEGIDARSVEVFSPLLANYPAGQAVNERKRKETWNIVVNSGDLSDLDY